MGRHGRRGRIRRGRMTGRDDTVYLVMAVLNKGERLEEILEAFIRLGIKGATVFDGTGYGEHTAYRLGRISFVRGTFDKMLENRPKHKIILSLVEDLHLAKAAVSAVGQVCERPPKVKAHAMVIPVESACTFGHEHHDEAGREVGR